MKTLADIKRAVIKAGGKVEEADGCEDITITKEKMHREIYEGLPEFQGF